jgi:hypothetical protein
MDLTLSARQRFSKHQWEESPERSSMMGLRWVFLHVAWDLWLTATALTTLVRTSCWLLLLTLLQIPAAPDAFVQGIMEGKEWIWDNGLLKEREVQNAYNRIEQSVVSNTLNEQTLAEFERLLFS